MQYQTCLNLMKWNSYFKVRWEKFKHKNFLCSFNLLTFPVVNKHSFSQPDPTTTTWEYISRKSPVANFLEPFLFLWLFKNLDIQVLL